MENLILGEFDIKGNLARCRQYLIEKLAVMYLWINHFDEFPYNFIVYPKPMHYAAKYLYNKFVKKQYPDYLKELVYTLNNSSKNTQIKPKTNLKTTFNLFGIFSKKESEALKSQITDIDKYVEKLEGILLYLQTIFYKLKLHYKFADGRAISEIERHIVTLTETLLQAVKFYDNSSSSSDEEDGVDTITSPRSNKEDFLRISFEIPVQFL